MLNLFQFDRDLFEGPVLVTGAGGCIGSWVLAILFQSGVSTLAFDLSAEQTRVKLILSEEEASEIPWVIGNISEFENIEKAVVDYNIKAIIHLAALQVPFCANDPIQGAKANVLGTVNIFEVCRKYKINKLVYASSVAAYGLIEKSLYKPTLYGAYKLCNENIAKVYSQDWNINSIGLRPGVVYGIGRDQGMTSKTTEAIRAIAAKQNYTIPFSGNVGALHAGEAASAFIKAILKYSGKAEIFDINGTCTTVSNWIKILNSLDPNVDIDFEGDPLPFPFDMPDDHIRNFLGEYPSVDLKDGIRETYNSFKVLIDRGLIKKT